MSAQFQTYLAQEQPGPSQSIDLIIELLHLLNDADEFLKEHWTGEAGMAVMSIYGNNSCLV